MTSVDRKGLVEECQRRTFRLEEKTLDTVSARIKKNLADGVYPLDALSDYGLMALLADALSARPSGDVEALVREAREYAHISCPSNDEEWALIGERVNLLADALEAARYPAPSPVDHAGLVEEARAVTARGFYDPDRGTPDDHALIARLADALSSRAETGDARTAGADPPSPMKGEEPADPPGIFPLTARQTSPM